MKVRIKDVPEGWECDYLTLGKKYDFTDDTNGGGHIVDEDGQRIFIYIPNCEFLDGGSWEIIPDTGDESEERIQSQMLHGTEG